MKKIDDSMTPQDKNSTVKEIHPGIFMRKTKANDNQTLVVEIENKLFKILEISIDFSGSEGVLNAEGNSLKVNQTVRPFEKNKIIVLQLLSKWKVKNKFKYILKFPPLEDQIQQLIKYAERIDEQLRTTKILKEINNNNFTEFEFFEFLREKRWVFVDHEFPPNSQSIGCDDKQSFFKYKVVIHFKRASTLFYKKEIDINKDLPIPNIMNFPATPTCVRQGLLDNCWLAVAIAALTKHPKLIERLFLTKKPNKYGYFRMKLCKMNLWNLMCIDDYLPCFPMAEPIFLSDINGDIWAPLIEKMFAKMQGSYERLEHGETVNAFVNLTGCPSFSYNLSDQKTDHWNKMRANMDSGYLVTLGSNQGGSIEFEKSGVLPMHAYNVNRIYAEKNVRLLLISTVVAAEYPWTGVWANHSAAWTNEMLAAVAPNFDKENLSLWISWDELQKYFSTYTVCLVAKWETLNLKGKFVTAKSMNNPTVTNFASRWYYQFEVNEPSKLIFGVHQEDEKLPGNEITSPFLDIGIVIGLMAANEKFQMIDIVQPEFIRQTYLDIDLGPGRYVAIPFSSGVSINFPKKRTPDEVQFNFENSALLSAGKQIFSKFDTSLNRLLNFSETKAFYKMIGKDITEADFEFINDRYGKRNPNTGQNEGIAEKGFINLFLNLISAKSKDEVLYMMNKLGFDEQLFSWRSRTFIFSCHSDNPQNIQTVDSLENNIDFRVHEEILCKYGIEIGKEKFKFKPPLGVAVIKFANQ